MLYPILATIFFASALIFIKLTAAKISPILANVIFLASAVIVQLSALLYAKLKGINLFATPQGIKISLVGGIFIGFYTIFLLLTFSKFEAIKATPFIYIGAISLVIIFGALFLKEPLNYFKIIGLLLSFAGLFLLFKT